MKRGKGKNQIRRKLIFNIKFMKNDEQLIPIMQKKKN